MDAKLRFSDRVEDYVRYRPGYPGELVERLAKWANLSTGDHVVDLGAGTGLLSREFLGAGYRVTAVEPNGPMREAGIRFLHRFAKARFVEGSAEATGLDERCCDLVVAGQAFHWFDPLASRAECLRIARPPARCAMIWNERCLGTPFMDEYEALLLEHAPDYLKITASHVDPDMLGAFFGGHVYDRFELDNDQSVNGTALRGRLMSSSYAPMPGSPGHDPLMRRLDAVFARHAVEDRVTFRYRTVAIHGCPLIGAG